MHGILRRLVVGGLLVGGLTYFALVRDDSSPDGLLVWDPTDPRSEENLPRRPGDTLETRDESEEGERNFPTPQAEIARPQIARGRVLRFDGEPIEGVSVLRTHPYLDLLRERTDEEGRFEFHLQSGRGQLDVDADAWVALGGRRTLEDRADVDYVLVLAPRGRVQGHVLGPDGIGVADASVRLAPPSDALVPFGLVMPPAENDSWAVWSSADGGFRFERAPDMPGVVILVAHPQFESATAAVKFEDGRAQVEIRLTPPQ